MPYPFLSLPGVHDHQRGILAIHREGPLVHIFCNQGKSQISGKEGRHGEGMAPLVSFLVTALPPLVLEVLTTLV